MTRSLSALNYLNVAAYIVNVFFVYAVGSKDIFDLPDNAELSAKYQTLVTPVGWAFAIWAIIFSSQAIFTVVQLLPAFRADPLVIQGVSYYYIGVCLSQVAWTFAFALEIIWLSFVMMLSILFFLLMILFSQYKTQESTSIRDFWLLKFPFSIHGGWIVAASFVNLSVLLVSLKVSSEVQFVVALLSIAGVLAIAGVSLVYPSRPEYIVPLVLVWATFGIYSELQSPLELISDNFSTSTIDIVKYGSLASSCVILLATIVRGIVQIVKAKRHGASSAEENVYLRASDNGEMSL